MGFNPWQRQTRLVRLETSTPMPLTAMPLNVVERILLVLFIDHRLQIASARPNLPG